MNLDADVGPLTDTAAAIGRRGGPNGRISPETQWPLMKRGLENNQRIRCRILSGTAWQELFSWRWFVAGQRIENVRTGLFNDIQNRPEILERPVDRVGYIARRLVRQVITEKPEFAARPGVNSVQVGHNVPVQRDHKVKPVEIKPVDEPRAGSQPIASEKRNPSHPPIGFLAQPVIENTGRIDPDFSLESATGDQRFHHAMASGRTADVSGTDKQD